MDFSLKENNFILVKNPKEYFENENYTKKYKDNIITTYQYLLAINKYSSRSYNNINEYPIMPWLIYDNKIREFDLPMSLQTEESRELFEDKYVKFKNMDMKFAHNNFYSSAPYTFFYLSRINPFTNGMIKFQGNCFEIPERQFLSVEITIQLCPKTSNNREPTPEIFEMPEIYYNLNCNDFGKSRGRSREHNISLSPFANNGIAFCYDLLGQINNDVEINNNINKWIDFIFGVNQYNDSKDMLFRRFNDIFIYEKPIPTEREQLFCKYLALYPNTYKWIDVCVKEAVGTRRQSDGGGFQHENSGHDALYGS